MGIVAMVANLRKWLSEEWLIIAGRYYTYQAARKEFVAWSRMDSVILYKVAIISGAATIFLSVPILLTLASLAI